MPASAHDWQVPVQAVWQQTPSTQKLEAHSFPDEHATPAAFFTQLPPLQTSGDTQSVSSAQVVLHAVAPQMYGSQAVVVTAWQVPVPLQVRAGVAVEPEQVAAAQTVPAP